MSDEQTAVLWSPEGTLVISRTPAGFKLAAITDAGTITMTVSNDDLDLFTDNLREMLQYA